MKIWVTKYALSEGIGARENAEIKDGMAVCRGENGSWGTEFFHGEGREWHRDEESAIARAEELRAKKIASHHKSIAKLEKMTFGKKG